VARIQSEVHHRGPILFTVIVSFLDTPSRRCHSGSSCIVAWLPYIGILGNWRRLLRRYRWDSQHAIYVRGDRM
jgi:hypothetical protein